MIGGGSVTFVTAPASGEVVTIYRRTPKSQGSAYSADTVVNLASIEASMDRLTLHVQELEREVGLALKTPTTDQVELDEMPVAERSDSVVAFDVHGQVNFDISREALNTLIVANPVAALSDVTDYGSISDEVTDVADYGSIV